MSFSSEASGSASAPQFKSFVTETELDEKRKARQAEWEKVRKADDPEEAPEEEFDGRSLFERLQEQKQKKDDEYEQSHRLRNQVKGLEEEEADFLNFVSERQTELVKAREDENESVLREYREAVVTQTSGQENATKVEKKNPKPQVVKNTKSQQALLAGVVKRKSSDAETSNKKQKSASNGQRNKNEVSETVIERDNKLPRVIAVLPGLGAYSNSSDSDSSSSDCEAFHSHPHRVKAGKQSGGHS